MKIVREITQSLLSKLPQDRTYFRPSELEDLGFPGFLVERISLELARNLADSVVPPNTDWANMDTRSVADAWESFLNAIHAETRLPYAYAESVIEASVADIIDMLVEPRKNIPEIVFGSESVLDLENLTEQTQWVVVYQHFGKALVRFVERKKLESLDKEKATVLLEKVDEKLTAHYTPLNWAVLLDPWFILMGNDIESDLLRRFFTDKKMPVIAKRFDREDGSVDRTRFIEILSKPDFSSEDDLAPARLADIRSDDDDGEPLASVAASKLESSDEDDEPILKRYSAENSEESEPKLADLRADEDDEDSGDSDSVPIWQRFVASDDQEEEKEDIAPEPESQTEDTEYEEEEPEIFEDDDYEEEELGEPLDTEPIIDLTKPSEEEQKNEKLHNLLRNIDDRKSYYIDMLFGGEENAFYNAMEEIAACNDWKEAARYITSEIFRRNMVDMYSDEAVDFTDRMQVYFLEQERD